MNDVFVGSFTGSAAAVNVECGFVPSAVIMFKGGTASGAFAIPGGAGLEFAAAATAATASDLLPLESETDGYGFTVIAGAAINVNTVPVSFIAFRGDR